MQRWLAEHAQVFWVVLGALALAVLITDSGDGSTVAVAVLGLVLAAVGLVRARR